MVLEARGKAESVGFPIVGDDKKDASNVIDYNINEEITKDKTAVINANNDTTTGMAGTVPGINSPKLIAKTSILGDLGGGGGGGGGGGIASGIQLVEISNYQSIDEWQPVVDRVIGGEFVVVHCKFLSYSSGYTFYFVPCEYKAGDAMVFGCIFPRQQWFKISCAVTGGVITSITTTRGNLS